MRFLELKYYGIMVYLCVCAYEAGGKQSQGGIVGRAIELHSVCGNGYPAPPHSIFELESSHTDFEFGVQ